MPQWTSKPKDLKHRMIGRKLDSDWFSDAIGGSAWAQVFLEDGSLAINVQKKEGPIVETDKM